MKRKVNPGIVATLAFALGACASTEETHVQSPPTGPVVVHGDSVPKGTKFVVRLEQPIGKDTKPGQTFTAKVAEPVVDAQGASIIGMDSTLMGRVGAVKSASGDRPAEVDLVVDRLLVSGTTHPVQARIVGSDVPSAKREVKGKYVAGGAIGGGVLGALIGGWQGAVIGGIAGAVTGTAISLGTSGNEAKLPAGTTFVVEIDKPINVAALRGYRAAR